MPPEYGTSYSTFELISTKCAFFSVLSLYDKTPVIVSSSEFLFVGASLIDFFGGTSIELPGLIVDSFVSPQPVIFTQNITHIINITIVL